MDVIGGNVGRVEEKISDKGHKYTKLSVAESKGFGANKETVWYSCNVFGSMAKGIEKGDRVLVYGSTESHVYKDKTYLQIHPFHIIKLEKEKSDVPEKTADPVTNRKMMEDLPF